MLLWAGLGYVVLGAAVAGACMGASKRRQRDLSLPRFLAFLALWPLVLLALATAAIVGRKGDR